MTKAEKINLEKSVRVDIFMDHLHEVMAAVKRLGERPMTMQDASDLYKIEFELKLFKQGIENANKEEN